MYTKEDLSATNPDLTPDVMAKVGEVIELYRGRSGCLIPVLTGCQEIVKYLPVELQGYISEQLNIPGSTVYGVVTFYSFFTMLPRGRHTIRVCMGTACYVKGIAEVIKRIHSEFDLNEGETTKDRRFSLEAVRCLGACGLAPVVIVDKDTHGGVTSDRILDILAKYE